MDLNLTIIEQIKIWQNRKGATTEELAAVIGVSSQNYSRRQRLNSFSSEELEKIAEYLGCVVILSQKDL